MQRVTYDFQDEGGQLLYQEVREPGKRFFLRRPNGNGGWLTTLQDVPRVLYRLPDLLRTTTPVIWCEGPKDVETLRSLGFTATTCAMGVNGWQTSFARYFKNRYLVVLRDNDAEGLKLRDHVVRDCRAHASRIVVLDLPGLPDKGDVTDWFELGHTVEEFHNLLRRAEREQAVPPSGKTEETQPTPVGPPEILPPFPELAWVGPLLQWRDILHRHTNAPDAFLWAAFMAAWTIALGRRLFIASPRPLYTNNYYLLLGETARDRKSTALWGAGLLLEALQVSYSHVSGLGSLEGLYLRMQKTQGQPTLLYIDEFRSLLSVSQRKVTENVFPRLNTLWDCPPRDQITKVETIEIIDPYLVLLSATPLRYAEERLTETHFAGGVLGRFLILSGSRREAIPLPPPLSPKALQPLVEHLHELLKALPTNPQEVSLNTESEMNYVTWFEKFDKRLDRASELEEQILARLPQHVLKMAIAYSALLGEETIGPHALTPALEIAHHIEKITHLIFSEIGFTHQDRIEKLILRCIRDGKGTAKAIKNHLGGRYSVEDLNRAISALLQAGMIASEERHTKKGRKFAWYRATEEECMVVPPEKCPT